MIELKEDAIDSAVVAAAVRSEEFGGVVVFEGVVRSIGERGQTVRELQYEAYAQLAIDEMERIADEARARWGPCAIAMQHRIGTVKAGEPSVAIAVACAHRSDAFEACAYAIEQLKRRTPIWKQERYADGSARWLDGIASGASF
ncbi:MAG: molybdenum cofactor biosynthesis protein MoaE [Candidatus Eremiobacteraeota bacterium]|nr:molybdenum cofactor biosynthesis protein MoaE [Candidatus Eremiobacteraeota bacterium]